MKAIIFALVFAVILGSLALDAQTLGLKIIAGLMSLYMFAAAIIEALQYDN